jgi:hypothetical protein
LAGTAYSLSLVLKAGNAAAAADPTFNTLMLSPMVMHFGWVTAATLVKVVLLACTRDNHGGLIQTWLQESHEHMMFYIYRLLIYAD